MSSYVQHDSRLESMSLDDLLSMQPQAPFDGDYRLDSFTGLATPPEEPGDFIQRLANQNQVLACLRWLGEFQVLALIPLRGSISAAEVADLASVPVSQLSRIVRMTATAGFLCEPRPGDVAHTTLSARFVTDLSFFDAIMFLAESAAPSALQMATATERQGRRTDSNASAYSVALNTTKTFQSACNEQPRLQRRYNAYVRYTGAADNGTISLLQGLNWHGMESARVVDTNAQSTEIASFILQQNPSLRLTVQMNESATNAEIFNNDDGRLTVQRRAPAAEQTVKDAAVYILQLTHVATLREQLIAELKAHFQVLRASGSTLLVALPFVPEPGSVDPSVEMTARLWDLSRSQLTNDCDLEVGDLEGVINSISDASGKLVIINKIRSRSSTTLAVGIKYEAGFGGLFSATPLLA